MSIRKRRIDNIRKNQALNKKGVIVSSPDNPLLIIIMVLICFGSMAIFSASAPEGIDIYDNPAYYFIRHIIFVAIGLVLMFTISKTDYKMWGKLARPIAFGTILLIAATYIPGLGQENYGASRWLNLGIPVQPSELAKIATILLISSAMVDAKTIWRDKLLINLGLVGIMVGLIFKQPNLSISVIICAITAVLLVAGGVSSVLIGAPAALVAVFALPKLMLGYQVARIRGWLHPWADPQGAGYNLIQSWYAIGSGGLWGVGFGNSKQKLFWLPFRHTDFIFAVIAEELGFIGCLLLIGLFMAFIHRGFLIANRCTEPFGRLVALGITFSIGIQAFINISVAVGVLPVTGVTLPLISYGGTSVIVTMMMLGILLNISRKRIKRIQQEKPDEAR